MTETLKKLKGVTEVTPIDLSWEQAKARANGWEPEDRDEDWEQKEAEDMAEKIRTALGPNLIKKPHIFAMAIQEVHPKLHKRMLQYVEWQDDVVAAAEMIKEDWAEDADADF